MIVEPRFNTREEGIMQKIRVLIVDDSAAVRDGLSSILSAHADIEVVGEAVDGLDAVAKAQELQPDVILMDAQMPGVDGIEVTRRIKARFPETKVLFLAVHTSYIEEALAAGADSYLMKDCRRGELLKTIRELGSGATNLKREINWRESYYGRC